MRILGQLLSLNKGIKTNIEDLLKQNNLVSVNNILKQNLNISSRLFSKLINNKCILLSYSGGRDSTYLLLKKRSFRFLRK